ncbi:MAG: sugar phosphate nucleotidyltransferase [Gilvibacter sp.]
MKHLVILAGGASTRMKAASNAQLTKAQLTTANAGQKGLIVLEGDQRPMLDYLIKNAAQAGYSEVVLITGKNQGPFAKVYGNQDWNHKHLGVRIHLAMQHLASHRVKPWGTADALQQALEQIGELRLSEFAVCNCDNLYSVQALSSLKKTAIPNALIAYDRNGLDFDEERISKFAAMLFSDDFELKEIVEKPTIDSLEKYRDATGTLRVSMNLFKFNGPDIYPALMACEEHPIRKEKELPTALLYMIQKGVVVKGIPLAEHVPDLTIKEDIAVFKKHIK